MSEVENKIVFVKIRKTTGGAAWLGVGCESKEDALMRVQYHPEFDSVIELSAKPVDAEETEAYQLMYSQGLIDMYDIDHNPMALYKRDPDQALMKMEKLQVDSLIRSGDLDQAVMTDWLELQDSL